MEIDPYKVILYHGSTTTQRIFEYGNTTATWQKEHTKAYIYRSVRAVTRCKHDEPTTLEFLPYYPSSCPEFMGGGVGTRR